VSGELSWLTELLSDTDGDHPLTMHCETRDEVGLIVVMAPTTLWEPGWPTDYWLTLWVVHDGGDGHELDALRMAYDACKEFSQAPLDERIEQWLYKGDSITPYEIMHALGDDTGWRADDDTDGRVAQWSLYNMGLVSGPDARELTEFGRRIWENMRAEKEADAE
jgi:hypothetical protein